MDRCHYCGEEYHPMPVWTRGKSERVHVCDFHVRFDEWGGVEFEDSDCPERAELEGFVRRPDLTPKR